MTPNEVLERVEAALEKITRREGAFNRDPLIHAGNVIDEAEATAREALALLASLERTHVYVSRSGNVVKATEFDGDMSDAVLLTNRSEP